MPRLALLCGLAAAAAAAAAAAQPQPLDLHVCCGCGADGGGRGRTRALALDTLEGARRLWRAAPRGPPTRVFVSGTCRGGLALGADDGGASEDARVTITSYPGEEPGVISGGVPLLASALAVVTDAGVIAQMAPGAAPYIRQVDLAALGLADLGTPSCHPYMGGEASILPGNLVKAGLEVFMLGDPTVGGDLSPLTLARYPNKDTLPQHWAGGNVSGYVIDTDAATTPRLARWAQQLAEDPGSLFVHYIGGLEWDDHVNAVSAVGAGSITLAPCPSHYAQPGFDSLDNKGTFYVYNLLSELDTEGEYYVNRTSRMLYLWPPSAGSASWQTAPWGRPVVGPLTAPRPIEAPRAAALRARALGDDGVIGELSVADDLVVLDGTAYLSFDGLVFTTARNAAVIARNTTSVTVANALIQNTGSMAVNASGGAGFLLASSVVRHAGNGAVYFYAGDRVTLTLAGHALVNSTVSYSNRYLYCYVPMVALADCGNRIGDSELFGGPHQGIFMSGNLHEVARSTLHDLVEAVSDSGVIYTGRDFTYQGSVIKDNTFLRINTADAGDDVSAVYLDDLVSGYTVTGNTFRNVSRALLLGGGRDNVFTNNSVAFVDGSWAVSFDDRGEGWAKGMCTGEMTQFLARVPFNTSAVWIARFPSLAAILSDDECQARHNVVSDNTYCYGAQPEKAFIDTPVDTINKWGSAATGNVHTC